MGHEIERGVPWPFPGGHFPDNLGVIVQRTVHDGIEPARAVIHDTDGDWLVSDEVNDPNEPDAAILVCMHCLAEKDQTLATLASMPPGTVAWRPDIGGAWQYAEHSYEDESHR